MEKDWKSLEEEVISLGTSLLLTAGAIALGMGARYTSDAIYQNRDTIAKYTKDFINSLKN